MGSGEVQHDNILLDLEPYLGVRSALPVLLLLLLGLGHHCQQYVSNTSAIRQRYVSRYVWRRGLLFLGIQTHYTFKAPAVSFAPWPSLK